MNLFCLLSISLMLAPTYIRAGDSEDCARAGIAISACTRLIESGRFQGSQLSTVYYNRGTEKKANGDYEGAIADYDRAIELNPRHEDAYHNRGHAKNGKGDFKGAIADYTQDLKIHPEDADTYYYRAAARQADGDLNGAIADASRSIELSPNWPDGYEFRGRMHYHKGEFALAAADLARQHELKPYPHAAIMLFLARARSGGDGKKEFAAYMETAKLDAAEWPGPVTTLYLGKSTPDAVLKAAEDADPKTQKERLCEGHFYAGEWLLVNGDRPRALAFLRAARDRCPRSFMEYDGAVSELKRLEPRQPAKKTR